MYVCIYHRWNCRFIYVVYFLFEALATLFSAPQIITHPTDISAIGPFSATFKCSADACDSLSFEWKRIHSDLPEKSFTLQSGNTSILSISNVTSEDVGKYYCVAWANNKASESHSAELGL